VELLNFWYDTNGIIFTSLASLETKRRKKRKNSIIPNRSFMRASYALLLLFLVFVFPGRPGKIRSIDPAVELGTWLLYFHKSVFRLVYTEK
jgi:hypothetical protein